MNKCSYICKRKAVIQNIIDVSEEKNKPNNKQSIWRKLWKQNQKEISLETERLIMSQEKKKDRITKIILNSFVLLGGGGERVSEPVTQKNRYYFNDQSGEIKNDNSMVKDRMWSLYSIFTWQWKTSRLFDGLGGCEYVNKWMDFIYLPFFLSTMKEITQSYMIKVKRKTLFWIAIDKYITLIIWKINRRHMRKRDTDNNNKRYRVQV